MSGTIFFGYPAQPRPLAETLRHTARNVTPTFDCVTWEDLRVGGAIVISKVLQAIDESDFCIFDITRPNQNVLFEVGYALARGKPLWLTADTTVGTFQQNWRDLAILRPVAYEGYRNSTELSNKILAYDPVASVKPLYDTLIEPALPDSPARSSLLYCPPFEPFEAANRLSTLVEQRQRRGLPVITADPQESSLNPITWYAPQLGISAGVLINFAGRERNLAAVYNARNALVAGMAIGLEVPSLMLAEDDYTAPFDYEHILVVYDSAAACVAAARVWLDELEVEGVRVSPRRTARLSRLSGVRAGEHVAENELAELPDYFLPTAAYYDVVRARDALFVGHRGTGKTANALQAFDELSANKENLAVLIKPASFEFPGLLATLERLPDHTHDYLFDTLWRFVVQTELGAAVLARIEDRPTYVPLTEGERTFVDYAEAAPFDIRQEMSVRLDQALSHLLRSLEETVTVASGRDIVNEAFHEHAIVDLRHALGFALRDKKRVAVFIDNLDKGWQRGARLDLLARLILGLLSARGHLVIDFSRQDWWRDEVRLTMAIFLRSDIFTYVKDAAREPDKLNPSAITWRDPEVLIKVIEERIEQSWPGPGRAPSLWEQVFCPEVAGVPTRQYILELILPRPRDLIFFSNAAISRAIDRRHDLITEEDLLAARDMYSQYAYEALRVENGISIPELEEVLFTFLEGPAVLDRRTIYERLSDTPLPPTKYDRVVDRLIEMSFLGVEVRSGNFVYPEVGTDMSRTLALAGRVSLMGNERFVVHPAFRPFLKIA